MEISTTYSLYNEGLPSGGLCINGNNNNPWDLSPDYQSSYHIDSSGPHRTKSRQWEKGFSRDSSWSEVVTSHLQTS